MNDSVTFTLLSLGCSISIGLAGCNPSQQAETPTLSPSATPGTTTSNTSTATQTPPTTKSSNTPTNSASPSSEKSAAPPANQASGESTVVVTAAPSAAARPPLTVEKLKNAEYYFLAKGPVKLVNGKYEDAGTKRTYSMSDVVTYGDINKDGIKDAVTVLKVNIPNTGDFSYLVALVNEGGTPKNISSEFMGRQVVPKTLKVKPDNSIEAVMDQYQPGDPECCPSLKITRTYKLKLNPTQPPASTQPK